MEKKNHQIKQKYATQKHGPVNPAMKGYSMRPKKIGSRLPDDSIVDIGFVSNHFSVFTGTSHHAMQAFIYFF